MKRSPLTIVVAPLLIAIFGLMLFVFQVRQSEVAVVTLFDKMESDGVRTNPGPHLQWPWPIERVYKLDQRVHSLDLEAEDKLEPVTLPDQNIILLLTYVGWRISDPAKFFPKFENGSITRRGNQFAGHCPLRQTGCGGQTQFLRFPFRRPEPDEVHPDRK